jgi:hypothetical protein
MQALSVTVAMSPSMATRERFIFIRYQLLDGSEAQAADERIGIL